MDRNCKSNEADRVGIDLKISIVYAREQMSALHSKAGICAAQNKSIFRWSAELFRLTTGDKLQILGGDIGEQIFMLLLVEGPQDRRSRLVAVPVFVAEKDGLGQR